MTISNENKPISKSEAVKKLWEAGNLQWLLDSNQKELREAYRNAKSHSTLVWECSRRLGKSYVLCAIAIEACLAKPNIIVKYVAPKQNMVRKIIQPIIRQLIQTCPKKLKPKYHSLDKLYRFPNGSEIQLAGTDNGNADNLRGGSADLCIVDEAGFCTDLEYVVKSILLPTMTTTKGKLILSSTPSPSMDHEFIKTFVPQAKVDGTHILKTIYDNPRLTPEEIAAIEVSQGGRDSVSFRREYLCEHIVDATRVVVPEFTLALQEEIVQEWKRPPYFNSYVAMDIGFKDLTAVLFGYYDFNAGKIIIEDEISINGPEMTTDKLAEAIKAKEIELWGERKPNLRVSDNNYIVLNDLQSLHKLTFIPTQKDDAEAALNHMRMKLSSNQIIINPKCKQLIFHLQNATWNKSRTDFERSKVAGHYDFVPALTYFVRNVNYHSNPYPPGYDLPGGEYFKSPYYEEKNGSFKDKFSSMFKLKSTIKKS